MGGSGIKGLGDLYVRWKGIDMRDLIMWVAEELRIVII